MKLRIDRNELIKSLEAIQITTDKRIAGSDNGVLFETKDNILNLEGNNFNVEAKTFNKVEVEEQGSVNVVAPQLLKTVKLMPSGMITLTYEEGSGNLQLSKDKYNSRFPVKDNNTFPRVTGIKKEMEYTEVIVEKEELLKAINQIVFAVSTDKNRAMFTGVVITTEKDSDVLAINASDTYRVARKTIKLSEPAKGDRTVNIPADVIREIARQLDRNTEIKNVKIIMSTTHTAFIIGNVYLKTTLISGEYPDIRRVIPKKEDTTVKTNLKTLMDAVSFVDPISQNTDFNIIQMKFNENTIEVSAEDGKTGTSKTIIPCENMNKKEITMRCKSKNIREILKHSEGEDIFIHLLTGNPIRFEQELDKDYVYVTAPLRAG